MKKMIIKLIALILLWPIMEVSAGIRGYRIVFIDLTPREQFKPIFLEYRKSTTLKTASRCWSSRKGDWIDVAYVKTQPIRITQNLLISASSGDASSVKHFSILLKKYRDDELESGFDGAFFATKEKSQNFIIGISNDGMRTKSLPFLKKSIKTLDQGLCEAADAFDNAFNP